MTLIIFVHCLLTFVTNLPVVIVFSVLDRKNHRNWYAYPGTVSLIRTIISFVGGCTSIMMLL